VINDLVLNPATGLHESPYRPGDVALSAGAIEALRLLRGLGVPLALVSNQPSAAKGTATLRDLAEVDAAVMGLLADAGLELDEVRYCLHHPQGTDAELGVACDCRKPAPGLIFQAAEALGLDAAALGRSWLIGDSDVDIEAGRRAGLRTVLVADPHSAHRRHGAIPDAHAADVLEASRLVVAAAPSNAPAQEAR
jgi:D-glycero-D-manno-heptose 1,7-bisphosphate phosphatase